MVLANTLCDCTALRRRSILLFFFFNDTATTEIYTLSLHDALPISQLGKILGDKFWQPSPLTCGANQHTFRHRRSEEHTSELQSQSNLVCRLLLEKKKNRHTLFSTSTTSRLPSA